MDISERLRAERATFSHLPAIEKILLIGADLLALAISFGLAHVLTNALHKSAILFAPVKSAHGSGQMIIVSIIAAGCVAWFWLSGHYTRRRPYWDELREIFKAVLVCALVNFAALFLIKWPLSRLVSASTWVLAFILLPLFRIVAKRLMMRAGLWLRPTLIIGFGQHAAEAARALRSEPLMGLDIVGFGTPDEPSVSTLTLGPECFPVYGLGPDPVSALASFNGAQIVIAMESETEDDTVKLAWRLSRHHPDVYIVPALKGLPLHGIEINHHLSHDVLFLRLKNNLCRRGPKIIKRTFDLCVASALLLCLSPLFFWVALRIWLEDHGPAFYSQQRIGKNGRTFRLLKFRTMAMNADAILRKWKQENPDLWRKYRENNFKLPNDPRITRIGRSIRRASIDELPQLWNVLKGEMSLVGPRPFLERERTDYGDTSLYFEVLPGITGLWQVSGRSKTTFEDRATLDGWYVRNWSLWHDVVILIKTIRVVFARDGAY